MKALTASLAVILFPAGIAHAQTPQDPPAPPAITVKAEPHDIAPLPAMRL